MQTVTAYGGFRMFYELGHERVHAVESQRLSAFVELYQNRLTMTLRPTPRKLFVS